MTGDPDLDQACEDLAEPAKQLRHLQHLIASPHTSSTAMLRYQEDLTTAREDFETRGERLRLHADKRLAGRTLLLVVEEVARLRRRYRRRPTGPQLRDGLKAAGEIAELDRVEAEAEFNIARLAKAQASYRAASSAAALMYVEASRAG